MNMAGESLSSLNNNVFSLLTKPDSSITDTCLESLEDSDLDLVARSVSQEVEQMITSLTIKQVHSYTFCFGPKNCFSFPIDGFELFQMSLGHSSKCARPSFCTSGNSS